MKSEFPGDLRGRPKRICLPRALRAPKIHFVPPHHETAMPRAEVEDTFAEAFRSLYAEVLITACDRRWLDEAVRACTGNASSTILCDCEWELRSAASVNWAAQHVWPAKAAAATQIYREIAGCYDLAG